MGSKGSNTTTTDQTQQYTPNPMVGAAGTQALTGAMNAANQPFQMPTAPVAGFNPFQQQAFGQIQGMQGMALPYINQGQGYLQQSAAPITGQDVAQYYNPMADNVTRQMQNIFGQQNLQNTSQLTQAAGGVGADRIGVGQANMANQQGLAAGQTYAGLYQQALQGAQQQKQMEAGAGYGISQLGPVAQNAYLQGTGALGQAGGQQQQQSQAELNAPYQNRLAQIAYPFQTAQYLAGIAGGLGPAMGGTTTGQGTQTQGSPSPWAQMLGIGTGLVGLGGQAGMFGGGGGKGSQTGSTYGAQSGDWGSMGGVGYPTFQRGGNIGFDAGGPVEDQPLPFPGASVPKMGGASPIPYMPMQSSPYGGEYHNRLNLNPQQQSGSGGGGGDMSKAIGTAAQMAMMFMRRGGAASAGGSVNPYDFGQSFDAGGNVSPIRFGVAKTADALRRLSVRGGFDRNQAADYAASQLSREGYDPLQIIGTEAKYAPGGGVDEEIDATDLPPLDEDALGLGKPVNWSPAQENAPASVTAGATPEDISNSEDVEAPANATFVQHRGQQTYPQPQSAANADMTVDQYTMPSSKQPYPDATQRDWGQNAARSPWMALVKAGAAMAQTRGPIGSVIGAGLGAGAGALESQRKELRSEQDINQKAQGLYQQAVQHLNEYQRKKPHEVAIEKETTRYHDILDAQRRDFNSARSQDRADALSIKGFPGNGTYADGTQGPGFYQFNPSTRKYDFQEGVISTGKGNKSAEQAAVEALSRDTQAKLGRPPTADEIAGLKRSLKGQTPAEATRTQGAQTAIGLIDESTKMLDDAISGKTGSVSGLAGAANRYWQFGKSLVGEHATTPSDFQQRIELLQTTVPRLLASTSRITSAERGEIASIVGGLSRFKSPEEVKNNLIRLRQILSNVGGQSSESGASARPTGLPNDARQGQDGSWYSPDPNRPGKYLKWGQ